jgi:hypothetical protein
LPAPDGAKNVKKLAQKTLFFSKKMRQNRALESSIIPDFLLQIAAR